MRDRAAAFYGSAEDALERFPHLRGRDNPDYAPMIERIVASIHDNTGPMTRSSEVAEAIWRVANDPSAPLRIAAGADAEAWMAEAG